MSDTEKRNELLAETKKNARALMALEKALPKLEKGWIQCDPGIPYDQEYCALSAINSSSGRGHNDEGYGGYAGKLILEEARATNPKQSFWSIPDWNDNYGTTKNTVLEVFRTVIKKLKGKLPSFSFADLKKD